MSGWLCRQKVGGDWSVGFWRPAEAGPVDGRAGLWEEVQTLPDRAAAERYVNYLNGGLGNDAYVALATIVAALERIAPAVGGGAAGAAAFSGEMVN